MLQIAENRWNNTPRLRENRQKTEDPIWNPHPVPHKTCENQPEEDNKNIQKTLRRTEDVQTKPETLSKIRSRPPKTIKESFKRQSDNVSEYWDTMGSPKDGADPGKPLRSFRIAQRSFRRPSEEALKNSRRSFLPLTDHQSTDR